MNQPPLDELLKRTNNKYALVVRVARRAREIAEEEMGNDDIKKSKPVTRALFEIIEEETISVDNMNYKEEIGE